MCVVPLQLELLFLDMCAHTDADFHCAVAISLTALDNIGVTPGHAAEAMRHLSHAFRMVNERLANGSTISDGTMAVVIMMSKYEPLRGKHRLGLLHLEGLQRMVDMRGGISKLAGEKAGLTQKMFR